MPTAKQGYMQRSFCKNKVVFACVFGATEDVYNHVPCNIGLSSNLDIRNVLKGHATGGRRTPFPPCLLLLSAQPPMPQRDKRNGHLHMSRRTFRKNKKCQVCDITGVFSYSNDCAFRSVAESSGRNQPAESSGRSQPFHNNHAIC